MSEPRLRISHVSKRFGPTAALSGVRLSVAPAEVHAVVGENGAGKSTLMKILSGALTPDDGDILLDGSPYCPADPLDARRRGVAMVYQELSLAPHLSVADNILLGDEPSTAGFVRPAERDARARAALEQLDRADIPLGARTGDLPLAVQQLVEVARSLAQSATRVLILDEPTSSLADDDVRRLFTMIRRLRDRGLSVIYISHVLEEVRAIADRLTVLRDGATVGEGAVADTPTTDIVRMMAGRQLDELFPRSPHTPTETILEFSGVAGVRKPDAASLSLRRGEVVGIGGLVGAGRTELMRLLFGLDPVRRGTIRVASRNGWARPRRRLEQGVGLVSEDRKEEGLALALSVADNVTLTKLRGLGPGPFVLPSRQQHASSTWVDRLRIKCRSTAQSVRELSGGNQQKVAIARLLHHDADVYLLDEPTRGIDVGSKADIYALVDKLALAGKAVLLVSSYLPELLGVCDRVSVMHRGHLGPARPVADLTEHDLLMEATGQA